MVGLQRLDLALLESVAPKVQLISTTILLASITEIQSFTAFMKSLHKKQADARSLVTVGSILL